MGSLPLMRIHALPVSLRFDPIDCLQFSSKLTLLRDAG
jgi:hypothetical protein